VSAVGRNEPCPCGSGGKTKRCCGVKTGPSEAQLARSFLALEARRAAPVVASRDELELRALWDEIFELPGKDLSLLVPLPELLTPDIERLCSAVSDDDPDEAEAALPAVLAHYDAPIVRAGLARSVIALRDRGSIPTELAALALVDLGVDSTAFLRASLIRSVAILAGVSRTPAGLVLAAR
jgi:SEC-C motif